MNLGFADGAGTGWGGGQQWQCRHVFHHLCRPIKCCSSGLVLVARDLYFDCFFCDQFCRHKAHFPSRCLFFSPIPAFQMPSKQPVSDRQCQCQPSFTAHCHHCHAHASTSSAPNQPLTPSKCANQQPPPVLGHSRMVSPLKMLSLSSSLSCAGHPYQAGIDCPSSNSIADLQSLPPDAFLSLDPLEENDPYHLLLLDSQSSTLNSLFGHEL